MKSDTKDAIYDSLHSLYAAVYAVQQAGLLLHNDTTILFKDRQAFTVAVDALVSSHVALWETEAAREACAS
jgi:hypothetical protein